MIGAKNIVGGNNCFFSQLQEIKMSNYISLKHRIFRLRFLLINYRKENFC